MIEAAAEDGSLVEKISAVNALADNDAAVNAMFLVEENAVVCSRSLVTAEIMTHSYEAKFDQRSTWRTMRAHPP
jgi:hypothetical protein